MSRDISSVAASTLIICDDLLLAAALPTLVGGGRGGVHARTCRSSSALSELTGADPTHVFALAESPGRLDGYEALAGLGAALQALPSDCVGVVIARQHDDLVRLRIGEAGAKFLYDYDILASNPALLASALVEPDERFRLPTRWELRERSGLAWDGDAEPFLAEARELPRDVWASSCKQAQLPISRREVMRLRRLAFEVAGLPAPDFRRFGTTMRAAPGLPEWSAVRAFVRRMFGLERLSA